MAFSVSVSVYLLFNAMAALSEEVALNLTLAITTQPSNWTVNKTKGTEVPTALKFSHPCLEHHDSYCINGVCAFHRELKKAICRCFTGYTGERCEHLTLTSYAVNSYEKYIAIWIGVGVLLSGFLAIFYCYIRMRHTSYEISDCLLIRCRPHDGRPSVSLPPEMRLNYLTELIYPQD